VGSELQISVLGELKVTRRGEIVPLPRSKKTRALLAYLAVVGRPQRREHLCDMLWDVPDDPRASLRWSLYKIRQIANGGGHERLIADHNRVVLDPNQIEVDFNRVASLFSGNLDSLNRGALEQLIRALNGEFLEDICLPRCPKFEAWRIYHADAVSRLRERALQVLAARRREASEPMLIRPPSDKVARELERIAAEASAASGRSSGVSKTQVIRFCRAEDGVRIAFATCGRGPPLVRAAHWMSHLQYDWESPVWRHWIDALSETTALLRYDERGNGLSDWNVAEFSFEAMVADLESVVEAAGLDRFTLLGVSQSCAVSVAYAVRHPGRIRGLILYGGFARGWRKRGDGHEIATHEAMTTLIREGWGKDNPAFRQLFTETFIPGASREQMAWFNELQRNTVSPANAVRLLEAFGQIDVTELLPRVAVPTLVMHARRDAAVPFESGRHFATAIPQARFVELDSANHILLRDEPAFQKFRAEAAAFVAEVEEIASPTQIETHSLARREAD